MEVVEIMVWKIEFFATARGDKPVSDFIRGLDDATIDKVFRVIDVLERYGPRTPAPFVKRITKDISELRTTGKNAIRILYCRRGERYVLLHTFKKKTNKLPSKELTMAIKRANLST